MTTPADEAYMYEPPDFAFDAPEMLSDCTDLVYLAPYYQNVEQAVAATVPATVPAIAAPTLCLID